MLKIKNKIKFKHAENRMKNEGNVSLSILDLNKNKNLFILLNERFSWMNKFIKKDDIGIEVGAAAGFSKKFINCKNFKISDFSDHDHLDYKNIDAQNTGFKNEEFDFILSSNMIHHLPYPVKFFNEMHRILKKDGRLIIFDAHLMSEGAGESANALLQILEEPPDNTSLILVTDKKSKLPLTIVSRCQQIDFSSLAFEKVRELIENDQVSNDRATQLAMLSNGNMHLANQLTLYGVSQPLEEAYDIIESFTMLDESKWRNSINSFSMLAFRKPEEFVFKMCLIQMWMNLASKFKYGKNEADFFNENFNTFEEFNNKYPNADFFEINNLFESSILALNQNLYMPLFIIDMIISMQTLLKGEKPKIII